MLEFVFMKESASSPSSYFGVLSIRQGMRWIQAFMFFATMLDIYPAVTQAGYECEMSFTDASDVLGPFSQVLCWVRDYMPAWEVCKASAMFVFLSEFTDQLSLFFGLILIASPKPSIKYVIATRYLTVMSAMGSVLRLVYNSSAYFNGESFLKSSSTCMFESAKEAGESDGVMVESLNNIIYEVLSIIFFSAYIWGTYALVTVLKRGGTGDEKVAGSDVLSLVRRNPPKLLVLSSFFGMGALRPASLLLSCVLLGISLFGGFSNGYRMVYWCGQFDNDSGWCVWPYGILSAVDSVLAVGICGYSVRTLLDLKSEKAMIRLTRLWAYLSVSSLVLLSIALYILAERFPSYWMDGMRGDFWIYYTRFWIAAMTAVLSNSIAIVRLAGGVGWEDEAGVRELIYSRLSQDKQEGGEGVSESESLADLFGAGGGEEEEAESSGKKSLDESPLDTSPLEFPPGDGPQTGIVVG